MSSSDYALIGAVCGSIFQIVLCVGVISGCVSLCCWCHKRCRRRRPQNGVNVIYVPAPVPPEGYQPSLPNYYSAPVSPPHFGLPMPTTPPPSYQEATSPGLYPVDVSQRPPVYPNPLQWTKTHNSLITQNIVFPNMTTDEPLPIHLFMYAAYTTQNNVKIPLCLGQRGGL